MTTTTLDDPGARAATHSPDASARQALGRQPLIGVAGLVWVAAVFLLLGVVPGPLNSLQVLGPLTIFMLPTFVVVAIWWQGRPAVDGVAQPAAGAVNLAIIAIGAVASTWIAQALVARGDLVGIFTPPASADGRFVTFPFTVPIAAATIVAMLQLTFVCEQRPFAKLGGLRAGIGAFVASWVIGLAVYYLLANWDAVPADALEAIGMHNPGGPMDAIHLVAFLLCVALWQNVYYTLLEGRPFSGIRSTGLRIAVANVVVVTTGWAWYMLQKQVFDWPADRIAGVVGVGVAACFIIAMLFEHWPYAQIGGAARILVSLSTFVVVTAGLFLGLRAFGNAIYEWGPAPVELWVGVCGLNYLAAGVILHYAVFARWPYEPPGGPA